MFEQAEYLRANYTHPVLIFEADPAKRRALSITD